MAWEWSHASEAYSICRDNLFNEIQVKKLVVMYCEWKAAVPDPVRGISFHATLDMPHYTRILADTKAELKAGKTGRIALAEFVWENMEKLRTCTNGGFFAWGCPFGCACHYVSFSTLEERMRAGRERAAHKRKLNAMFPP